MPSPLAGKSILVVSEDADLAVLVGQALRGLGAEVPVAASGSAALAALARRPHAAVVDLPLPDLRGSELLTALSRSRIPAVVVSGVYRGGRAWADLRRLGAGDFFEKPFPVDALARAVSHAAGATAEAGDAGETSDEVTGARPLRAEEVPRGIAAALLPALLDAPAPVLEAPAAREGLASPLPDPPRPPRSGGDLSRAPPARGDLAGTSVPRLLVALHLGQASGALTVTRAPVKKIVALDRGAVVYAASNLATERFASLCIRRGVVAEERLEELRRERPETPTAELLQGAGLLAPAQRAELVAGQVRAIVWSTFEWREGTYEFQAGRAPTARLPLRFALGDLVLEGMLRASTLERLALDLPRDAHLAPSPDPAFELWALRLRAGEARLLSLADGTKSVGDLARLSDLPERETLAFLQACRVMRVLDDAERVLASTRRIGFM